jgi:hypothetical protein
MHVELIKFGCLLLIASITKLLFVLSYVDTEFIMQSRKLNYALIMFNFLDITLKFHTIAMFVIVDQ